MASGFYGEIVIRFVADTKSLQRGLTSAATQTQAAESAIASSAKKSAAHWERAGLAMQNFGRTMTQFVTLPVVAGFAVASVAGYRYEKALLQLKNLTGLTAEETKKYGEALKDLAPKVGVGPQALAEAMYFVSSSGFKAAEAMKVVTLAAKASAAGMGDVQVLADAVTSAMNSFGHENLSAARAFDILMKTVQVGKAEPAALATSLGRIMPVAAQLGVEFEQLGGMIAGLTLGGLSSAEAVTALRGTMVALVAPAKMSIKELKEYGLSVGDVKRKIREEGLLEALQMLYEKTGGNELAMRKIIPNVRALNGVMSLLGENYGNARRAIDEVTASHGKLNQAFGDTKNSAVFKMDQAIASIKASFTDIGQTILPALAKVAKSIADFLKQFRDLSPATQEWVIKLGLLAAAIGPVSMVMGSLVRSAALVKTAFSGFSLFGAGGASGMGGVASGVSTLGRAAALATGPVGLFAAAMVGLAAGLALVLKHNLDPTGENWKKSAANMQVALDKIISLGKGLKDIENKRNVEVGVKVVMKDDTRFNKLLEKGGTIVIGVDDVKAWGAVNRLHSYINDPGRWTVAIKTHLSEEEIIKSVAKVKIPPQHAVKLPANIEHESLLRAIQTINITEKVKPIKIPAGVEFGTWTNKQIANWLKSLTPRQQIQVKWALDPAGAKATEKGNEIAQNLAHGLSKSGKVKAAAGHLSKAATPTVPDTYNMGISVGQGLANGMNDTVGIVEQASYALSQASIVVMHKQFKNPPVPSRVTMEMGRSLAEGLALGIKQSSAKAIAAAAEIAGNILSTLDAALAIDTDIGAMKQNGLFSVAEGRKWGKKIAVRLKAMFDAMWSELKGLNLLDQEVGKGDKKTTVPGIGQKFSAIATMAGDIGSILSAFSEMTEESLQKSFAALALVKTKARQVSANIVAMVKALRDAMAPLLITQTTADNVTRAAQVASDLASIITTFAEVTDEKVGQAMQGMASVVNSITSISGLVSAIAIKLRDTFAGIEIKEEITKASSAAAQLCSDIAGVITSFAELTEKKIGDAMMGAALLFNAMFTTNLLGYIIGVVWKLDQTFKNIVIQDAITKASADAAQLVGDIAGIITSMADMTQGTIESAMGGISRVIAALPDLTPKLLEMVAALTLPLQTIAQNESFKANSPLATQVATFVGDVANIFSSLAPLAYKEEYDEKGQVTSIMDIVGDAKKGAEAVEKGIKEGLMVAINNMVMALVTALDVVGVTDLSGLANAMSKLNEIATSIKGIIDSLADVTAPKISAATAAGNSLGAGFYTGLKTQMDNTLAMVKRIVGEILQVLSTLPGGYSGSVSPGPDVSQPGSATVPEMAQGGIVTRPTLALIGESGPEAVVPLSNGVTSAGNKTVVNQNFSIVVNALEPDERIVGKIMAKMGPIQRRMALELARSVPR